MWKKLAALPAPALALLFLLGLLRSPAAALEGARRGLAVCAGSIVPALLPFLVLSGLVRALGLADRLAGVLARPLGVLLHIAAGNADGLPAFSVAEGLATGNINILKLPQADNGLIGL